MSGGSFQKSLLLWRMTSCRTWTGVVPNAIGRRSVIQQSNPRVSILSLGYNMTTSRLMSSAAATQPLTTPQSSKPFSSEPGSLEALLHSINLFAQRSGRILDQDSRKLLSKLYLDTNAITPNHALFAIRCLGSINVDMTKSERQKLLDEFFAKCQEVELRLDISHHNALLKAYLENDHQFSPTAILTQIANAGLQPNRVTYQHLIRKYCNDGDIDGATTILEHMKQINMPVNEQVFQSLVLAHAKAGDYESADKVIEIMQASGIDVNISSYTTKLEGMILAGEPAEVINDQILGLVDKGLFLGDSDYLQLIIAFCQQGNIEAAKVLSDKLPRNTGYFNILRNSIPALIQHGQVDLALSFLATFGNAEVMDTKAEQNDHGFFILRCVVNSGASPNQVLEAVEKLDKPMEDQHRFLLKLVQHYISSGRTDQIEDFVKLSKEKYGKKEFPFHENFYLYFLKNHLQNCSATQTEELMHTLAKVDLCHVKALSQCFFPALYDRSQVIMSQLTIQLQATGINIEPNIMYTAAIQFMLSGDDSDAIKQVAVNSTFRKGSRCFPHFFKNSLARHYLMTKDIDSFKVIFFNCSGSYARIYSSQPESVFGKLESINKAMGKTLSYIYQDAHQYEHFDGKSGEEVLNEVLEAFVTSNIGVHPEAVEELLGMVQNEATQENLRKVKSHFENFADLWSMEKYDEFNQSLRQAINSRTKARSKPRTTENLESSDPDKEKFRRFEVYMMSELKKQPASADNDEPIKISYKQAQSLVNHYMSEGKMKKALESQAKLQEHGFNVRFGPIQIKDYILKCFSQHQNVDRVFGEDLDPLSLQPEDQLLFSSVFFEIAFQLASKGKEKEALRAISAMECLKDNLLTNDRDKNNDNPSWLRKIGKLIRDPQVYSDMITICNRLGNDRENMGRYTPLLLSNHLDNERFEEAVALFEDNAAQANDPRGFKLLVKELIQHEEKELLQRALDAVIQIKGEENSVYHLAAAFVELDRIAQAKRLFQTPGLRYDHFLAQYLINGFRSRAKATEEFIKMLLPIFGSDQKFLFERLVHTYDQDSDKIQEIWILMQDHGYTPSDQLLGVMAKTLKKDGKSVPFEIPDEEAEESGSEAKFDVAISREDLNCAMEEFNKAVNDKKVKYSMVEKLFTLMSNQQDFSSFQQVLKDLSEFPTSFANQCLDKGLKQMNFKDITKNAPTDEEIRRKLSWGTRETQWVLANTANMKEALQRIDPSLLNFIRPIDLGYHIKDSSDPAASMEHLKEQVMKSKNADFAMSSIAALIFCDNEGVAQDLWKEVSDQIEQQNIDKTLKALRKREQLKSKVGQFLEKNGTDSPMFIS